MPLFAGFVTHVCEQLKDVLEPCMISEVSSVTLDTPSPRNTIEISQESGMAHVKIIEDGDKVLAEHYSDYMKFDTEYDAFVDSFQHAVSKMIDREYDPDLFNIYPDDRYAKKAAS